MESSSWQSPIAKNSANTWFVDDKCRLAARITRDTACGKKPWFGRLDRRMSCSRMANVVLSKVASSQDNLPYRRHRRFVKLPVPKVGTLTTSCSGSSHGWVTIQMDDSAWSRETYDDWDTMPLTKSSHGSRCCSCVSVSSMRCWANAARVPISCVCKSSFRDVKSWMVSVKSSIVSVITLILSVASASACVLAVLMDWFSSQDWTRCVTRVVMSSSRPSMPIWAASISAVAWIISRLAVFRLSKVRSRSLVRFASWAVRLCDWWLTSSKATVRVVVISLVVCISPCFFWLSRVSSSMVTLASSNAVCVSWCLSVSFAMSSLAESRCWVTVWMVCLAC
ncbi:hypothetical protein F4780DRAFT_740471, partial [Xylariomycetidae sp. FL0641]